MRQRGRFQSGDYSLTYDVTGSGPPVILVHGLLGSRRWWSRNIPELSRHFRVYAVDLEGFGGNLTWHPFALDRVVASLARFVHEMKLDRVGLIGHSLGGLVSLQLAMRVSARIERLILVDAAVLAYSPSVPRRMAGLVHAIRWTPIDVVPLLAVDAARAGPISFASAVHDLFTTDHREDLAQVPQPTLVIWGEHDTIVPMEIGVALTKELPNARLVVVEHAGHTPMWEQAMRFNAIVTDFFEEVIDAGEPGSTEKDPK